MMNTTGTRYVLAREQTDLSDEVRAAPAPALPTVPEPFGLRVADPNGADPALLSEWMHRPHLLAAWEQPWSAERREQDLRAQLAGTYSLPCIVSFDFAADGRPELGRRDVAYLELYRPAKDEIARLYHADPYDVAMHLATAEQDLTGRRMMAAFAAQLLPAIFAAEPKCRRIMIDPDHRNVAVRRVAERFGAPSLGEFDIRPDRRITLYTKPRTPADMPTLRH
ncbi:GNAT family N-acetyltransferase [Nocardia sp. NPDC052316]|uniref:GNAT family N-acetyltransferase n=1 Tax=Nocardia sp. NPDC052316 TaxID=3364329 RepID=UPI0037CC2A1B